ncbi:MAG: 50S ribosomal protein L32 [Acidobacteria bacterium]|nr:MAG: 50S ribosomal protein L32 [Acidobacteriota bacterium]
MANPKRRSSKARRDKRRAHDALPIPSLARCDRCGEPKLPHRVCPACGHYKGREILSTGQSV